MLANLTFRRPRLAALALLMIVSAGASALLALGRQEDPTITNIFATVTTPYPGASPARVEALVTAKIEEELRRIPEVAEVESTSAAGVSIVSIELSETLPDDRIEGVWSEIRDALGDARREFPEGVPDPEFASDGAGAFAAIVALRATDPDLPLTAVARRAEALADRLRALPGTEKVEVYGAPEEEVLVEVDPAAAAALGVTADEISAAVRRADAKVRAGRVTGPSGEMLLEVSGEIDSLARLRAVVLRTDGEGRAAYLGDIARITRGERTPPEEVALSDGLPAVLVAARISEGLQVDAWTARVRGVLAEAAPGLPASVEAELIFDQSVYTVQRLTDLGVNLALGVAIVVAVLFLTLGARSAAVVALALPLVSLASLATLKFLGVPIHQMSVTGLIVALGLVVDAAIVMVDEIGTRRRRGEAAADAVGAAVRRLAMPLLASTLTTVLSFLPMILLPGPAGDFVGSIAIAVVVMLGWSLVVALAITPALAGWLTTAGPEAARRPGAAARAFAASLRWTARNPVRALALSLVAPLTGFAAMPTLTPQFFPGVDRDQFTVEIELQEGAALAETRRLMAEIDARLRAEPDIRGVAWVAGRSAPAFYYNLIGDRDRAPAFAMALVSSASPAATDRLVPELQTALSAEFPAARVLVKGLVQGPPVDAPVEIRLVGPDPAVLRERGEAARAVLSETPGIVTVRTTMPGGAPELRVEVDEAKARLAGLDLGGVARQLEAALEGVAGGSLLEGTEELPVRVRLSDALRADPEAVLDLPLLPPAAAGLSAAGRFPGVPLSALAELRVVAGDGPVTRRNGERANTVQAFVAHGVLPEAALARARTALDAADFALPAGYRLEIGGDSDARASTLNNLLAPLGLIVTLSIAVVALTFDSFRLTAVTFAAGGLSAGLSILSLAVPGLPFGITAIIGVIGSVGVSINAAIMILTGLQQSPGAARGEAAAVAEVVSGSARHILSTTITTFGGFLPLILAGGGFWPPFAVSIAGGVLLSSILSFYFAPAAFQLVRPRVRAEAPARPVPLPAPEALRPAA